MKTLEEITYEAGRAALADQETRVAGVRQRTGTLLAAHALVASFLGGTALREDGLQIWGWLAMLALLLGLVLAAVVLAPWRLAFAVDPRDLYATLYPQVLEDEPNGLSEWLAMAGYSYRDLQQQNGPRVLWLSRLSAAIGALMVTQTVLWLLALRLS